MFYFSETILQLKISWKSPPRRSRSMSFQPQIMSSKTNHSIYGQGAWGCSLGCARTQIGTPHLKMPFSSKRVIREMHFVKSDIFLDFGHVVLYINHCIYIYKCIYIYMVSTYLYLHLYWYLYLSIYIYRYLNWHSIAIKYLIIDLGPSGQKHQNQIMFSPRKKNGFSEGCSSKRGAHPCWWIGGPTQSNIANKSLDCVGWLMRGRLLILTLPKYLNNSRTGLPASG